LTVQPNICYENILLSQRTFFLIKKCAKKSSAVLQASLFYSYAPQTANRLPIKSDISTIFPHKKAPKGAKYFNIHLTIVKRFDIICSGSREGGVGDG
jgi:hypothetical protein